MGQSGRLGQGCLPRGSVNPISMDSNFSGQLIIFSAGQINSANDDGKILFRGAFLCRYNLSINLSVTLYLLLLHSKINMRNG